MGIIQHTILDEKADFKRFCIKEPVEMPKVSIIIPVYNVENYICECLESLIMQTFKELEFICINDNSDDNSYNILKEYSKSDSRFVILNQNNEGPGVGRNRGIDVAKGEYIVFVDADDKLELNAIEQLYAFAKDKGADVVQFDYINFDGLHKNKRNDFIKKYRKNFKYDLSKNEFFNWNDIKKENLLVDIDYHACRFYKTSFVRENHLQFAPTTNGEDHLFVMGALFNAKRIYYYNKALYWYRLRPYSITNTKSDKNFCAFTNIELAEKLLKEQNLLPDLDKIFSRYKAYKLYWHYSQVSDESTEQYLKQVKEYLSADEYKYFKNLLKKSGDSFIERIFSSKAKRINGIKYKYIYLLGIKFQVTKYPLNIDFEKTKEIAKRL